MARMVRKQLYIDEAANRELDRRASSLGVTQAELVRRAIARFLANERDGVRESALGELEAAWRGAAARGVGSGGIRPSREQLHER